ncbi:ComEA family DNA-binding protein [Glycomyces xiaoerkulensis]|uniref:ComEA family DNA-binding protein n=1 Tax=Glycomyces xiaoerkulensis TaxID=2038139 RepID=UPI000C258EDB|nr:ComEA family DNA-binding protein [Glycomyces xiaoerkulensis]
MDVKDPTDRAALASRLQLKLAESSEPQRVCEETIDAAEDGRGTPPRAPRRRGLSERAERFQARLGLSHVNRWVLVAVAVVAAATGLSAMILSWPQSEPAATAEVEPTASPATQPETIVVSVAGAVRRPGIVELESGSRVADAIAAAGGMAEEADPGFLNLARVVTDGDLVAVPDADSAPETAGSGGAAASALVNPNVADERTLTTLNGIGPVLAERIVAHREANGSFQSVEELADVQGIGPSLLDQIRDQVAL